MVAARSASNYTRIRQSYPYFTEQNLENNTGTIISQSRS